jgi:hypothetical protein
VEFMESRKFFDNSDLSSSRPVVQWQRHLSYKEETGVRLPPGRLDSFIHEESGPAGALAACLRGREVDRVRFSGGPWFDVMNRGLLVQRDDAWLATRRSGFDSPAVHSLTRFFSTIDLEGSRIRLAGPHC